MLLPGLLGATSLNGIFSLWPFPELLPCLPLSFVPGQVGFIHLTCPFPKGPAVPYLFHAALNWLHFVPGSHCQVEHETIQRVLFCLQTRGWALYMFIQASGFLPACGFLTTLKPGVQSEETVFSFDSGLDLPTQAFPLNDCGLSKSPIA